MTVLKGQEQLIEMFKIVEINGTRYMYFPFWIKKVKDYYQILDWEKLPKELQEHIQKERDGKPQ